MPIALITEPWARTVAAKRPKMQSATYSARPKDRAKEESVGPATASAIVATVPAKKEPSAAMASAAPALPLFYGDAKASLDSLLPKIA